MKILSSLLLSLLIFESSYSISEKKLNEEIRSDLLKEYKGKDPENYKELLKMVKYDPFKNKIDVYYDNQYYKNIDPDYIADSDEFFARILYPCKRKNEEWGNWITNVQLNPKAQYILAKAMLSLSSWSDLIYMLKKTRPLLSDVQLSGLESRKRLLNNPFSIPGFETEKVDIKCSNYIINLGMYSFLATIKKPFTEENIKITKAITLDVVATGLKRAAVDMVDGVVQKEQIKNNLENAVEKILAKKAINMNKALVKKIIGSTKRK